MPKEEKKEVVEKEVLPTEAVFVEVPSQFMKAIQLPDGEVVTIEELQVKIYNKLLKIEKTL